MTDELLKKVNWTGLGEGGKIAFREQHIKVLLESKEKFCFEKFFT
jgi:hypothetical protein